MKRACIAIIALGFLQSCQSAQQQQQARLDANSAYCKSIGAVSGEAHIQCMNTMISRDLAADSADAQRRQQQIVAGTMMLQAAQPVYVPPPRMTTTNCHQVGQTVSCTTF